MERFDCEMRARGSCFCRSCVPSLVGASHRARDSLCGSAFAGPVSIIFGGYRLGAARVASADNESHSRRDVSGDVSNAHALRRRSPPSRDDRTRSTSAHTVLLAGFTCTGVGTVEEKTAFLHEYLYGTSLAISDLWWCRAPAGVGATVNLRPCRLCYWRRRLLLM